MNSQNQLCIECGTMVSSENDDCPKCGAKLSPKAGEHTSETTSSNKMKRGCLITVIVFLAIGIIGAIIGPNDKSVAEIDSSDPGTISAMKENADSENDPGISALEFQQLQTGISYSEAVAIIGSEGELMSESAVGGIRTAMYTWDGETGFGANANAIFQNDEMVQKAQFGLE